MIMEQNNYINVKIVADVADIHTKENSFYINIK